MRWIKTRHIRPLVGIRCLVVYQGVTHGMSFIFDGEIWQDGEGEYDPADLHEFTHWMPLPDPPKVE